MTKLKSYETKVFIFDAGAQVNSETEAVTYFCAQLHQKSICSYFYGRCRN